MSLRRTPGWDLDSPCIPVTYGSTRGAVAVDALGSIYMAGTSSSTNLPVTLNAAQPRHAGGFMDAFVVKVLDLPALPQV